MSIPHACSSFTRYVVRVGDVYVGHARFGYQDGRFLPLVPAKRARVYPRYADAEKIAEEFKGVVEPVTLIFGTPGK